MSMTQVLDQLGIYFTQVAQPEPLWVVVGAGGCSCASDQGLVGDRIDHDSLLHEAVEQFAAVAGATPVEPESELVQVEFQMVATDGALMGAEDPALDKRGDPMNPGQ